MDESGNGNTNGDGDVYHNHYASISDASVNGHDKDDVAIARTIVMVERS